MTKEFIIQNCPNGVFLVQVSYNFKTKEYENSRVLQLIAGTNNFLDVKTAVENLLGVATDGDYDLEVMESTELFDEDSTYPLRGYDLFVETDTYDEVYNDGYESGHSDGVDDGYYDGISEQERRIEDLEAEIQDLEMELDNLRKG